MKSVLLRRAQRRLARIQTRVTGDASSEDLTLLGSIPEFDLVFADDSRQNSPTRPGMGPLVAVGGLSVAASTVAELGKAIENTCSLAGFPAGEEFKWSPGRELWMRDNLVDGPRSAFFRQIIAHLIEHEVTVAVVVVDGRYKSATRAATAEEDATRLFLERVEYCCGHNFSRALVVTDDPPAVVEMRTSSCPAALKCCSKGPTTCSTSRLSTTLFRLRHDCLAFFRQPTL